MARTSDIPTPGLSWSPPPPGQRHDEGDLETYHKAMVTRHVLPIMSVMSALFYAAYFTVEPAKVAVLVFGLLVIATNVFLTTEDRRIRFFRWELRSRSDAMDAWRWILNLLVADVALAVAFKPTAAVFLGCWLVLVASAQADLFQRRHRFVVVALGLAAGAALLRYLYPDMTLTEYLLTTFCMSGVVVMIGVMESYWMRETFARVDARRRELEARFQADRVRQDAVVGGHLRTVSHELNNLLGVLDMATSLDEEIKGRELAMVRKAIGYAKKINDLVLGDIRAANAMRVCGVRDLMEDIDLLLSKEVRRRGIAWQSTLDGEGLAQAGFKERGGSTYFIVHNLVKNAWEALETAGRAATGAIRIEAKAESGRLLLRVSDNAGGIDDAMRAAILSGNADTTKADGHGLGLRFVVDECRKNRFDLGINSVPGQGTTFELTIPIR